MNYTGLEYDQKPIKLVCINVIEEIESLYSKIYLNIEFKKILYIWKIIFWRFTFEFLVLMWFIDVFNTHTKTYFS